MSSDTEQVYNRLRDKVKAGVSNRDEYLLIPTLSALLIVDIQSYLSNCNASDDKPTASHSPYFKNESLPRAIRNISALAAAFRVMRDNDDMTAATTGCEVIWTFLRASTKDGRDISLDYKLSGMVLANIPRVDVPFDDLFLSNLRPDMSSGKGDILLPKTSCSAFQSTNLDYLLRNLGIEQLVIVGQLTDQCIEGAVRDAADLGYFATVVNDACAAESDEAHCKGLDSMKGFARVVSTAQVIDELEQSRSRKEVRAGAVDPSSVGALEGDTVIQCLRGKCMDVAADDLSKLLV